MRIVTVIPFLSTLIITTNVYGNVRNKGRPNFVYERDEFAHFLLYYAEINEWEMLDRCLDVLLVLLG